MSVDNVHSNVSSMPSLVEGENERSGRKSRTTFCKDVQRSRFSIPTSLRPSKRKRADWLYSRSSD